jgi:hypothetical protein
MTTFSIAGSSCNAVNTGYNAAGFELTAPALGGACASTTNTDKTQVTEPAVLYCDVPSSDAEMVCSGSPPAGFAACIAAAGAVACPAGTPFSTRYVTETGVDLSCTSCSACGLNPTCSNGAFTFYSDTGTCKNQIDSLGAGGCNASGISGGRRPWSGAPALKYSATASATCTSGTSSASTTLVSPTTVCCR